jgi:hypothetical protein
MKNDKCIITWYILIKRIRVKSTSLPELGIRTKKEELQKCHF